MKNGLTNRSVNDFMALRTSIDHLAIEKARTALAESAPTLPMEDVRFRATILERGVAVTGTIYGETVFTAEYPYSDFIQE